MLTDEQVRQAAENLWQAELTSEWAEPLSILFPEADVSDAYRVGLAVRDIKLANGRTVKGHKIGLTSKAMRDLTGATEPDYGFIFDNWFTLEGSVVQRAAMNRPLVEVELAFVMGQELKGPSINAADVIRATDFILPALEIVDSRYKGRGNNLLVDSISDAATCGFVVLGGNPVKLTDVDIRRLSASLSINGQVQESGTASAVMGNPINAVVWLANKLHEFGVSMQPGDVILSGSFVKAIPFGADDTIVALYDQLGEITLQSA
ncbi:2-keto-4-pentenoate hydratase [Phenylobacterium aquaticum]|uniref:2-keto-4-pentenoate hydratase n=1 Tax=Phenylobacterium aquaticum TaxID=1763816 RepID=UPI0026EBBC56|nr:fumarylacetoacetate hydrolase family protein [Phenylobacterium aquaticum]